VEAASRNNNTLQALLTRDPVVMGKMVDELTGINQRVDIILNIGVLDSNCVGVTNDRETSMSILGRNFSDRDHCRGILATGQKYVSSSYISSLSSKPVLSVSMPVKEKNGALVGYFATTVGIDKLLEYFRQLQVGNGRLILLDRAGNEFIDTGDPAKEDAESQNEISAAVRKKIADGAMWGSIDSVDKQGEKYLVDFKKSDYITVIIAEKRSVALSMMPNLIFTSLLISIASIFLSFSLFWLLVTRIVTGKLERITSAITKISTGDISVKIDDDLKSEDDEVGELARAFDRTLASLKLAILHMGKNKIEIGLSKALMAKKEAEERYATLFNSINEIVTVNKLSPDGPGKFVDVNDYACSTLGYSREEFLNMGPNDLNDSVKPGDARTEDNIKQLLAGKIVEYTSTNRTKSGGKLILLLRMRLIKFKGEKYVISTGRDITEKLEVEGKYKAIFEGSSDAVMALAPPDWKFIDGNPAALRIFGVGSLREFTSLTLGRLSPRSQPDGEPSEAKANAMISKAMRDGKNFFEWTYRRRNGEEFPASVLLSKVRLAGKEMLIATLRDLTDEKKNAGELSTIFESASTLIIYKDKNNRLLRVNKAFADSMGMKKEELEGKSLFDIYPRKQAEAYWKDDKEVMASGKPKLGIVEVMPTKSGTRWVQTDKMPYRDANGRITGIIAFVTDITAMKDVEGEREQEKAKLQALAHTLSDEKELKQAALDAIPDSFFVCDTGGKFLSWNKEFKESTGYSDAEIGSMRASDFFAKADAARVLLAIGEGLKKGRVRVSADVIAKDKTRLPTEFTGSVIRGPKGKIIGFAGVGRRLVGKKG
jgi:PAS domain S-box-containing protein